MHTPLPPSLRAGLRPCTPLPLLLSIGQHMQSIRCYLPRGVPPSLRPYVCIPIPLVVGIEHRLLLLSSLRPSVLTCPPRGVPPSLRPSVLTCIPLVVCIP